MGQGYTRNDSSNNIANGKVIDAADLDGEFDAIVDAFDASTGHNHDGTAAGGGAITKLGPNQEYVGTGSDLHPKTDDTYGLGTSLERWSELHVSGDANVGDLTSTGDLTVDGKVGIGTSSPSAKFDVLNTTAISTPAARFYGNINGGAISNLPGFQIYNNASGGFVDTTLVYGNSTNSYLAFGHHNGTAYSERMRIDSSGNVGIGTSSPSAKLEVAGYNQAQAENNTLRFTDTDTSSETDQQFGKIEFNSLDASAASPNRAYILSAAENSNAPSYLSFGTAPHTEAASEAMRIDSSGNVGIGTNSPSNNLQVKTSSNAGGLTLQRDSVSQGDYSQLGFLVSSSDSGASRSWVRGIRGSSSAVSELAFGTSDTERFRVDSSGNVGIGTTTPSATLDVNGDAEINGLTVGRGSGGIGTNTAVGENALTSNVTGNDSTAIGRNALRDNTTGGNNTALGRNALLVNTAGSNNVAIGSYALNNNTEGSNNTASGYTALNKNTTGANNTASGSGALFSNTTGNYNTASGSFALRYNTTGLYNVAMGREALRGNTTGSSNTALGNSTLYSNSTGSRNVAVGLQALSSNTVNGDNTAVGYQSLLNSDGGTNTGLGAYSLKLNTTGTANTATGYAALHSNTSGGSNTANGHGALYYNTTGNYNVASGYQALFANSTAGYSTAIGYEALHENTTGGANVAVGYRAMYDNTTGTDNVSVGVNSLRLNTEGANNTAVGRDALYSNTTGGNNTASGYQALYNNTTGSGNFGAAFRNSSGTYAPVFNPTTESNRVVMGHTGVTNAYVQVAWTVVSDARDKTEIEALEKGLDFVEQLNPVAYKFRKDRDTEETTGKKRYGFLAQEVLAVEGDDNVIVDTEDLDKLKMTNEELIPVLVKAVQELKAEVDLLKAQ